MQQMIRRGECFVNRIADSACTAFRLRARNGALSRTPSVRLRHTAPSTSPLQSQAVGVRGWHVTTATEDPFYFLEERARERESESERERAREIDREGAEGERERADRSTRRLKNWPRSSACLATVSSSSGDTCGRPLGLAWPPRPIVWLRLVQWCSGAVACTSPGWRLHLLHQL